MAKSNLRTYKSGVATVFQKYRKLKDYIQRGGNGVYACCTCGKTGVIGYGTNNSIVFDGFQCGHYVGRAASKVLFEEKNTHIQCNKCNSTGVWGLSGNLAEYNEFIRRTYGADINSALLSAKHEMYKFTRAELKEMKAYYQEQIRLYEKWITEGKQKIKLDDNPYKFI